MQSLELARERGEVTGMQQELKQVLLVREDFHFCFGFDQGVTISLLFSYVLPINFGLEGLKMPLMLSHVSGKNHSRDSNLGNLELLGGDVFDKLVLGSEQYFHRLCCMPAFLDGHIV